MTLESNLTNLTQFKIRVGLWLANYNPPITWSWVLINLTMAEYQGQDVILQVNVQNLTIISLYQNHWSLMFWGSVFANLNYTLQSDVRWRALGSSRIFSRFLHINLKKQGSYVYFVCMHINANPKPNKILCSNCNTMLFEKLTVKHIIIWYSSMPMFIFIFIQHRELTFKKLY